MFYSVEHEKSFFCNFCLRTFSASLISTDAGGVCTCNSFSGDATSLAGRFLWRTPRESDGPLLLSRLRHRLPDPASSDLSIPARSGEDAETAPSRTQTWSRGPESCGQDRTGGHEEPLIWSSAEACESQGWLPVDGGSRHDGAEDGGEERVVELHEEPAGFLHASAKESLCVLIQVTLNELSAHLFSEQVQTAVVPLQTHPHYTTTASSSAIRKKPCMMLWILDL